MSTMKLGPTSATLITVEPDYGYTFAKVKNEIQKRSQSGKLFLYRFSIHDQFELPISWINSSDRSLVNSWWTSNVALQFYEDVDTHPNSLFNVKIVSDSESFQNFIKPYQNQFYQGTILLETSG